MLLYLILVILLVLLIIWLAQLIVRKRTPTYKPTPVKEQPQLNALEQLVDTVKPKKEKPAQTAATPQQTTETEQPKQEQQTETQPAEQQTQKSETKTDRFAGRRGKPPKRPPRPNLRQAMTASQVLGKPKAKES